MSCPKGNQINKNAVPVTVEPAPGATSSIVGLISDTVERQPRLDAITHVWSTIDYAHHEVHAGSHFFISGAATLAGVDDVLGFTVTTPDTTKWAHMLWQVAANGPLLIQVYEGSSSISGGSSVSAVNSNRNNSVSSVLTIKQDPTVGTPGSLLATAQFGTAGTVRFAPTGGGDSRDSEMILKQNTSYYWKFTAKDTDVVVTYFGNWYEHTNKA